MAGTPAGFRMQTPDTKTQIVDMQPKGNLPMMKPDDMQYFDKLLVSDHFSTNTVDSLIYTSSISFHNSTVFHQIMRTYTCKGRIFFIFLFSLHLFEKNKAIF